MYVHMKRQVCQCDDITTYITISSININATPKRTKPNKLKYYNIIQRHNYSNQHDKANRQNPRP